ncbi:MAG: TRAP transporter large permease subunit [Chloroflexota bacterium]|nr:TRAP transporter large permease subunit [Chloroflexota bacterium]
MSVEVLTILMFAGILLGVATGFPIAFVLGGLGVLFGFISGVGIMGLVPIRAYGVVDEYIFACIPLFVFMGCMMERSGCSEMAFGTMHRWMGNLRGGLAVATVLICTLFAATTGIIGASVTTMGLVALPAMLNRGYNKPLATGCVCAGGTLGILIPPSIMLVLYAPMAGVSVARMFMAAFLPGLLLSALFIAYIVVVCYLKPGMAPVMERKEETGLTSWQGFSAGAKSLFPPLFLILAVLGSIFFGVAAPTEAASIGALGAIILAVIYGKLNWQNLRGASYNTLKITVMIVFICLGANLFTGTFLVAGCGKVVSTFVLGLGMGPWGIFALVLLIIFMLGMFIDWVGILLIMVPIFAPILADLGFEPLWFGLIICISLQMSFLTPPFAYSIFYLKGLNIEGVTLGDMYKGVVPFLLLQALGTFLCIVFPRIVTFLPSLM